MRKLTILLALLLIAAAPPPTAGEIGPEPSRQDAISMAEQSIRARLIDPASAEFEWPFGFTGGSLKSLFSKKHVGWITCGTVNSRNRMGGYSGRSYFQVVIRNGSIDMLDMDDVGGLDLVASSCQKMLEDGFLQPVPPTAVATVPTISPDQLMAVAQANAKSAAAQGGLGVSFIASPVGAVILAVSPGSKAEKAGLKVGETIEAVNSIPIKGMDKNAIGAILHSDAPSLVLKVSGVGDLTISR